MSLFDALVFVGATIAALLLVAVVILVVARVMASNLEGY